VAVNARGQDAPPPATAADARYFQGTVKPPPPGLFPQRTVRPVGGQPASFPAPPSLNQAVAPPIPGTPPAGKPRLANAVIAGPTSVQQVSGTGPVTVSVAPPAAPFDAPPPRLPGLPDPKPFAPDLPPPLPDNPPPPPTPARPALPPPAVVAESSVPAQPVTLNVPPPSKSVAPRPVFQDTPAGLPVAGMSPRAVPSITIEMNAPAEIGVNQPLTYELVLRNTGPAAVHNVRLEDELPPRTQLVGSDPQAEGGGDRLGWTLGSLDAGAERRVRVTVKPGEEGELRSRASLTYTTAVESRVKVTRPRVTVAVVGPDTVRVGDRVPFQIKLTNAGTGTADTVLLQARLTDGLGHPSGQVLEAKMPGLKAGETRTFNLDGVTGLRAGGHSLTLVATADAAPPEQAKSVVTLVEPMLTVKQTGPTRCLVKGEPTFSIELTNPGTAATDPIQLWAALPAGFEHVSASDSGAVVENKQVGWRLGPLAPGSSKTVTLKVRATAPADGVLRSVAVCQQPEQAAGLVQVEGRQMAARPLEARAETPLKAEGVPALRFEVIDLEDPVEVGKEAVYEIRVQNQGTGPCTNVQLAAELSEGTALVGATGQTAARSDRQVVSFDPIPAFGVKGEAVYRVRVRGVAPGDHRFRVRLVCDQIRTPVVKEENTRFYKE
jgi:uncharacterized repeat protein (TIGR01451 family)